MPKKSRIAEPTAGELAAEVGGLSELCRTAITNWRAACLVGSLLYSIELFLKHGFIYDGINGFTYDVSMMLIN